MYDIQSLTFTYNQMLFHEVKSLFHKGTVQYKPVNIDFLYVADHISGLLKDAKGTQTIN